MIRAVLDTNVLVSALLRPFGVPAAILHRLRDGAFTIVFSPGLLDEFAFILMHPKIKAKYRLTTPDIETVFSLLAMRGELCRDPNDDFLIEAAVAGRADYVVTGDKDLLVLKKFRNMKMVEPRAFLDVFKSRSG